MTDVTALLALPAEIQRRSFGLRIVHSLFHASITNVGIRLPIPGLCTLILFSTLTSLANAQPAEIAEIRPGRLPGYLPAEELPNALALLPASPANDSPTYAWEQSVNGNLLSLRDGARWQLAVTDNDLSFPAAAGTFSCALNAPVTQEQTPYLYQLLRRTLTDAGLATYTAKDHYQRTRPFVVNGAPICAEGAEERLSTDGSYPSGHTSIGWAWALILSELAPDRTQQLLARGLAYGDSRLVCNVHWPMDVVQGQVIGAATVARLHGDEQFRADMEHARIELAAVRAQRLPPVRDCDEETAALAIPVLR